MTHTRPLWQPAGNQSRPTSSPPLNDGAGHGPQQQQKIHTRTAENGIDKKCDTVAKKGGGGGPRVHRAP
jgi:hypothetical protein